MKADHNRRRTSSIEANLSVMQNDGLIRVTKKAGQIEGSEGTQFSPCLKLGQGSVGDGAGRADCRRPGILIRSNSLPERHDDRHVVLETSVHAPTLRRNALGPPADMRALWEAGTPVRVPSGRGRAQTAAAGNTDRPDLAREEAQGEDGHDRWGARRRR